MISYWYRSSGVWLYSGKIAYTGSSYTTTLGDAVDDLCIYPADALLSTYTYTPFGSLDSSTDASGKTTHYLYDLLNRLVTVKDHNGNITKQYCYNYAGQQSACYTIKAN